MRHWIIRCTPILPEIPEIDKVSVACAVVGGLEFRYPGIAFAQKRFGRYLGILDQKVEAGRDGCLAACSGRRYAVSGKSIRGIPCRDSVPPRAFSAAGTRQLILVIVGIDQHRLAETGQVCSADHSEGNLPYPGQRGHQNAHEQCYDRNYDQQLN